MYRSRCSFFGLSDEYIEKLYEQFFHMQYHGRWTFVEVYSLPIKIRNWFFKKLVEQVEKENKSVTEK